MPVHRQRPNHRARSSVVALLAACLVAGVAVFAGPVGAVRAATLQQTFTGAPGFPELGGPGEVLSIDAATASTAGGGGTYTTIEDLVVVEPTAGNIAPIAEDAVSGEAFLSVPAPAPFAWQAGSGTMSIKRADDASTDCGSLTGQLSVTTSLITLNFRRGDATNRCVVTVSGVKVIPTAASPLVSEAVLASNGSVAGLPGVLGVLALTTSQGTAPSITLTSSPRVTTSPDPTVLTATFASGGADREVRLEQSLDGTTWTAAGVVRTGANGAASYSVRPRFNRFYRFAFVGGLGLAAGVSNTLRIPVRFKAALAPVHARPTTIRRGTSVTFTTSVSPVVSYFQRPFVEFRLYHRSSNGWRLATTRLLRTNASGQVSWKLRFAVRGDWYLRARALQTVTNATSTLTPISRYSVR